MCSAFYMFRLPVAWHPFLCFNVCAKGFEIGKTDGQEYYLSCSVLPMGWHCSVGLMQEISERVLWNAGLPASQQIRRGVAIPPVLTQCAHEALSSERGFWQVYLDNFMAGDKRALHVNPSVGDHCTTQQKQLGHGQALSPRTRREWQRQKSLKSWEQCLVDVQVS